MDFNKMSRPPPGINDSLVEEGIWWLPSKGEDKLTGTLTVSSTEGATLALIGVFGDVADAFNEDNSSRSTIHGVTKKGQPVTLMQTFRRNLQLNFPGIAHATYYANMVAIGLHFEGADEEIFHESWVRFENIERWLDHDPFELSVNREDHEVALSVRKSKIDKLCDFGDNNVMSAYSLYTNINSKTEYSITVLSSIGIRNSFLRSLNWHFNAAGKIQELASLCSGYHLPILSLVLNLDLNENSEEKLAKTEVHIYARTHFPETSENIASKIPLISAPELLQFEPRSIERWFENYEIMSPVMNLLFTVVGERKMFVNVRFLHLKCFIDAAQLQKSCRQMTLRI